MSHKYISWNSLYQNFIPEVTKIIGVHEGFVQDPYQDSVGVWTVGYGFNLESNTFSEEQVTRWKRWGMTQKEGLAVLETTVQSFWDRMTTQHPWIMSQPLAVRAALLDLTYNMGLGWFAKFPNTIKMIQEKRYLEAARALLQSKYAQQVKVRAQENAIAIYSHHVPSPYMDPKLTLEQIVAEKEAQPQEK